MDWTQSYFLLSYIIKDFISMFCLQVEKHKVFSLSIFFNKFEKIFRFVLISFERKIGTIAEKISQPLQYARNLPCVLVSDEIAAFLHTVELGIKD